MNKEKALEILNEQKLENFLLLLNSKNDEERNYYSAMLNSCQIKISFLEKMES